MTTLIVLDTTETFGDLRMEGPDYVFLRSYIARHPVSLAIPQIVVEETVNHFREQLQAAIEGARSSLRALGRLSPQLLENSGIECDLDQHVAVYHEHLHAQLKLSQVKQVAYDGIRISSLVERALGRRKPFDMKGAAGFRDALLWESVLSCIASEKPTDVILVTRNKRDFGAHGGLADDLAADLASHGLSQSLVVVCEGLGRLVNERVKPSLETLDEIGRQLNGGEFDDLDPIIFFEESRDAIRDELADQVKCLDLESVAWQCVWEYRRPSLGRIATGPDTFNVVHVWRISTSELGIAFDFDVPGSIECFREVRMEPYGEPWDEEFNGKVRFKLLMTVVFNEQAKKVESWELNDLEVELSADWGFPDAD